MDKKNCVKTALGKGEMDVYDLGDIRLHCYKTNDLISDEVYIVEKDGRGLIIEAPCFYDNIAELTSYLGRMGIEPAGLLLSYHMAGASLLPGVPVYATSKADAYGHSGGGAALIKNFTGAFGAAFDSSIFTVTDVIVPGETEIAGIRLVITETQDAFDVELPQINAVYTHMLGHDCHSIVAGADHADAQIAVLEEYISRGFDLILTSHYVPEDLKDVKTKAAYLRELKRIAAVCADPDAFKAAVRAEFPGYSGDNYLEMTADMFYNI